MRERSATTRNLIVCHSGLTGVIEESLESHAGNATEVGPSVLPVTIAGSTISHWLHAGEMRLRSQRSSRLYTPRSTRFSGAGQHVPKMSKKLPRRPSFRSTKVSKFLSLHTKARLPLGYFGLHGTASSIEFVRIQVPWSNLSIRPRCPTLNLSIGQSIRPSCSQGPTWPERLQHSPRPSDRASCFVSSPTCP